MLLVDDVLTTGATHFARKPAVLKQAGARRVVAAVLVRTVRIPPFAVSTLSLPPRSDTISV